MNFLHCPDVLVVLGVFNTANKPVAQMSNLEGMYRRIFDLLSDFFLLNIGLGGVIYFLPMFQLKVYIRKN